MLSNAYFLAKFRFDDDDDDDDKSLPVIVSMSSVNFVLIQPRTSPPKICKIFEKCIFENASQVSAAHRGPLRLDVDGAVHVHVRALQVLAEAGLGLVRRGGVHL